MSGSDPIDVIARLGASEAPFLIGVRHHSPACAAAVPALLERFRPERILVELPADFQPWIEWLGHPGADAPLALSAATRGPNARGACFYPFADFSPELVAVRWARAHAVPVEAFDLPVGALDTQPTTGRVDPPERLEGNVIPDWDRLVESPAVTSSPESTRRAALLYGWGLRVANGAGARDLAREAYMRMRLRAVSGQRCAVITGAFHSAALVADTTLDPVARDHSPPSTDTRAQSAVVTSLIPYRTDLFDARSGYPAGVMDPGWHGRVYQCLTEGNPLDAMIAGVLVDVCRAVRAQRHVAGAPDAVEALRIALELARMRGLGAPGRGELIEAIHTAMGQGELLGRGRILAKAMERVMVGTGRGRLAAGTPRSGLLPSVEALIAGLRLPGPDDEEEKLLRLDPLRSELDRRRHVALQRLVALDIPYAKPADTLDDTLTHAWRVKWEPATDAGLALAGAFGATLEQATTGVLLRARPRDDGEDGVAAQAELDWLLSVAECGLVELARSALDDLTVDPTSRRGGGVGGFASRAGLPALVTAVALVDRIARGHVPGLQAEASLPGLPGGIASFCLADPAGTVDALYVAAVRSLDGLLGSHDPADAAALGSLVRLSTAQGRSDDGRLGHGVDMLARDGAPRMAGAATIARLRLNRASATDVGAALGATIDGAESDDRRRFLGDHLGGAVDAAGTLLESHPPLLEGIAEPIERMVDEAFLRRLPALRHGFDVLSTAARARLLTTLAERLGEASPGSLPVDADMVTFDAAGRRAVIALGLWPAAVPELGGPVAAEPAQRTSPGSVLPSLTRWRLVLGRQEDQLDAAAGRYANALDELYGHGHGEGSRGDPGPAGGRGTRFPTVREWADEIGALFGEGVRVEVVGRAAERGDSTALLLLDPEAVTPSITLLEQALSLKGGLSEDQLVLLRRLCQRVTASLAEALAVRVRPALTGLLSPRPTRRHTDRLHLRRTIEANLHTAHRLTSVADGDTVRIVPERLHFRSRARRHMDWHIQLVVDTSGSMEASVIHAAMMAAILAALPAVSVAFYAFADEVVDFTDRVEDPLALLLEVRVGGGTRIHRALRYARERVRVPTRTLLVLVSDLEEGGSEHALIAEVRALAESGVTMLGLAALDDNARPRFSEPIAARIVAAGMPVAALSPLELARWVAEKIRGAGCP